MRFSTKTILSTLLCSVMVNAHAITVAVKSSSADITALGFTVKGGKHGGLGQTYEAKKMPKGNYKFGLRSGGKDIACVDKAGKKAIKLSKNTQVTLVLKDKQCTFTLADQ